jgi:hypothetical protein
MSTPGLQYFPIADLLRDHSSKMKYLSTFITPRDVGSGIGFKKIKGIINYKLCVKNYAIICKVKIYIKGPSSCAAGFALLNLPKGKSLGRSKPATSSYAQALQHTMRKTSTISKSC